MECGRIGRGLGHSTCLLLYKAPLGETAKARLAILAFCLGDPKPAEQIAKLGPDPAPRTSLIAQFSEFNALTAVPARSIELSADAD